MLDPRPSAQLHHHPDAGEGLDANPAKVMHTPTQWSVACLNIQAGIMANKFGDYVWKSWHHVSPTRTQKQANLSSFIDGLPHVDIIGLQEVDPGSLRSGFVNQAQWLATRGRFEHWSCQANRRTGVSTTANAVLSRHPLSGVEHWQLPTRHHQPSARGALKSLITDPITRKTWCLVVAHLSLHPQDRLRQAHHLAECLAHEPRWLLMGDFNDLPSSPNLAPLRALADAHTMHPTYPRWNPRRAIDVVWWKNMHVHAHDVHQWGVTDHCGLSALVSLPPPSPSMTPTGCRHIAQTGG